MRTGTPRIVLLGSMAKMPVSGVLWQTLHYLVGLERLGFDVYYVEAHARTPSMFVRHGDDGAAGASSFLQRTLERFGLGRKWALHALHSDGRCYGLSARELNGLYESAALIVNLHGGTVPLPEHTASRRLLFLGTDPVQLEVELFHGNQRTIEFLRAHTWHFSYAENYGRPDCLLPVSPEFDFRPTRQPVILDWWSGGGSDDNQLFTTVGNWRQPWRDIRFRGDTYGWSKHQEFARVADLPSRTCQRFELALSGIDPMDREALEAEGWSVRDAATLSDDLDRYRDYIVASRGEFTVAKDQNVRFRSGWFSDRSATYLAAGRPVVTQDTGFGSVLPTGSGLFGFDSVEGAVDAIEEIRRDYPSHRHGARQIAEEFFGHRPVLSAILDHVGLRPAGSYRRTGDRRGTEARPQEDVVGALGHDLVILPARRCPTELPRETLDRVERVGVDSLPAARSCAGSSGLHRDARDRPEVSIVMVTCNKLPFTKLCVESLLANTGGSYELIVVDNGSADDTPEYLDGLGKRFAMVRPLFEQENTGFAAANNRGLGEARGDTLVLLNNDTIVAPGWIEGLTRVLRDPDVGAAGPVTNRICNEAQVEAEYRTYGEFLLHARWHLDAFREVAFEIPSLTMFCFAMRRDVFQRVGRLDVGFGVGTVEDDDYCMRILKLGLRLVCAEDVFVHHFGQASFGDLIPTGEYGDLLARNRDRFQRRWGEDGVERVRYGRRAPPGYAELKERVRRLVEGHTPERSTVAVVSKGDDELLAFDDRLGWHVPQEADEGYAGWYPGDSRAAIEHIESLRARGADYLLIPHTSRWWLDFYSGLRRHLESRYATLVEEPETCTIYALAERRGMT